MNEDVTAKPIPSKSLRLRSLWLVFVVCFIVFISIILNVAHHSLSSEYTKMRCKDTNFLSFKHQNAREIIHIYVSLTLKQTFFRIFGCKINRYQWYLTLLHLTRPRKGTINHENEHNVATIPAYYPPNISICKKAYTPTFVAYRPLLFPWSASQ